MSASQLTSRLHSVSLLFSSFSCLACLPFLRPLTQKTPLSASLTEQKSAWGGGGYTGGSGQLRWVGQYWGRQPSLISCPIFLVENNHEASPEQGHPELGSHGFVPPNWPFGQPEMHFFPGMCLQMALLQRTSLVQIVHGIFHHLPLFCVFNLLAWLSHPARSPEPTGITPSSLDSYCSPSPFNSTRVAVLKSPLSPTWGRA